MYWWDGWSQVCAESMVWTAAYGEGRCRAEESHGERMTTGGCEIQRREPVKGTSGANKVEWSGVGWGHSEHSADPVCTREQGFLQHKQRGNKCLCACLWTVSAQCHVTSYTSFNQELYLSQPETKGEMGRARAVNSWETKAVLEAAEQEEQLSGHLRLAPCRVALHPEPTGSCAVAAQLGHGDSCAWKHWSRNLQTWGLTLTLALIDCVTLSKLFHLP